MNEREYVDSIKSKIERKLRSKCPDPPSVRVESQIRLPYNHSIKEYRDSKPVAARADGYATDLLIYDEHPDGSWIPRVVVEVKVGRVSTHDALSYSSKAETHKSVHPYLRYGILIAGYGDRSLPGRLFRHGAHFDFMMIWRDTPPTRSDWRDFIDIASQEVQTSREIQEFLRTSRQATKKEYRAMHRPICFI